MGQKLIPGRPLFREYTRRLMCENINAFHFGPFYRLVKNWFGDYHDWIVPLQSTSWVCRALYNLSIVTFILTNNFLIRAKTFS